MIPILAAAYVLYRSYPRSMIVYPEEDCGIATYDDTKDGGSSEIEYRNTDSLLDITYSLGGRTGSPYAGVTFYCKNAEYWDVSKFNSLKLTIQKTGGGYVRVFIKSFIDDFSRPDNYMSLLFLEKELRTGAEFTEYRLDLRSFSTPKWWYSNNGLTNTRKKVNWKKIATVELLNSESCDPDVVHRVRVKKIEFTNRYGALSFSIFTTGFAVYGLLIFLWLSNRLRSFRILPAEAPYTRLRLSNSGDAEYGKIIAFLGNAFSDPDLTIEKAARATGVSIYKIPVLIRSRTNRSFKEYLNSIRLTEAQRLLSETDRQIMEISLAVGYNNVSHFNRIFKKMHGKTPRQFRDRHNGSSDAS